MKLHTSILLPSFVALAGVLLAGCASVPSNSAPRDPFASSLRPTPDARVATAIAPWVERGELPGAVSIVCNGDRTDWPF